METASMGKVLTEAVIENLGDLLEVERGHLPADQVRRITVPDAMVDTGATLLSLPRRLIQQLGLTKRYSKRVRSTTDIVEADVYGTARLISMGRECPTDVIELPDDRPALIGHIPLEHMDFVIDMNKRCLTGNPEHGGE